jgi:uncharacterized protein (TIGR03435 family)
MPRLRALWSPVSSRRILKRRVEEIMSDRAKRSLGLGRALALAAPIIVGMLNAPAANTQPANVPAFEAASIKPSTPTDFRSTNLKVYPNGRLVITNEPLFMMIMAAYGLPFQSPRISGGPPWIRSEGYDVEAVAGPDAGLANLTQKERYDRVMLMLRGLLRDRFALGIREDRTEEPVYAVVPARGGLKLQKAKIEEKDCPDSPMPGTGCHNFRGGMGRGMTAEAVSIDEIAAYVENWADRPVIDKTGIKGLYQVKTDGWVPMRPMAPRPPNPATGAVPGVAEDLNDPFRPTLFTVFEQMGLRLESQKMPVEVYVIEKADRPTQN